MPHTVADPAAVAELHVLGSTISGTDLDICSNGLLEVASAVLSAGSCICRPAPDRTR